MKFSNFIPAIFIFSAGSVLAGSPDLGAVSVVGSGRIGDNVVRYIRTFNDSCLSVQVLNPENNWKVLSESNLCSFEGKRFDSDFTDASFENIFVQNDGIHLTLSVTPLQPMGEQRRDCIIPIVVSSIKGLSCSKVYR